MAVLLAPVGSEPSVHFTSGFSPLAAVKTGPMFPGRFLFLTLARPLSDIPAGVACLALSLRRGTGRAALGGAWSTANLKPGDGIARARNRRERVSLWGWPGRGPARRDGCWDCSPRRTAPQGGREPRALLGAPRGRGGRWRGLQKHERVSARSHGPGCAVLPQTPGGGLQGQPRNFVLFSHWWKRHFRLGGVPLRCHLRAPWGDPASCSLSSRPREPPVGHGS